MVCPDRSGYTRIMATMGINKINEVTMLNQIQELQITEERVFTKTDEQIISYLDREKEREEKRLFSYMTGSTEHNEEIESELRFMLKFYGYRLHKCSRLRVIVRTYHGKSFFYNALTWYYSVTKYKRPGCHSCGIPENDPFMSRCYHWQNCHYGRSGSCQLAQITMN